MIKTPINVNEYEVRMCLQLKTCLKHWMKSDQIRIQRTIFAHLLKL